MVDLGRPGRELRSLLWRTRVSDEVDAELEFHLEMRVREYVASGLDIEEARRAALARLGDRRAVAARCRRYGRGRDRRMRRTEYLSELVQDIGYSIRRLRGSPLMALVAVATLALGIGATTAIFSAMKAVVLSPFPYAHPERVVIVSEMWRDRRGQVSPGNFSDWRGGASSFQQLAALDFGNYNLADAGRPERVFGAAVSPGFFEVFGKSPAAGRAFLPDEEEPGRGRTVILGHDLWTRRYAGSREVLGSDIRLNGTPHTVVGIMPAGFDPLQAGEDIWVPFALGPEGRNNYDEHYLYVLGLLSPGADLERANAEMAEIMRRQAERVPHITSESSAIVESLTERIVGGYDTQLAVLLGAVFFILLIACANVANLLLASGAARAKEIAVRAALGAGRGRIVRQLLTESLVMSLLAGAVGVWLAHMAIQAVVAAAPAGIPRIEEAHLDPWVLAFAVALSVIASLFAGLVPALRAARSDIEASLRDGRVGSSLSRRDRTRFGLVVAEVALAFTLVVAASLLIRSLSYLKGLDLGFDPDGLISARVTLPEAGYETPEATVQAFQRMVGLLRERPGVERAAAASQAPLGPGGNGNGLLPEGRRDEPGNRILARLRLVTPRYLEVIGARLIRGRTFNETDVPGADRVMVISESLAEAAFPGQDAVGKRIVCCEMSPDDRRWKTVVGVVSDVRSRGPAVDVQPEFYMPVAQAPPAAWKWNGRSMTLVARASGSAGELASAIRSVIAEVDPMLPAYRIRTMEEDMARDLAGHRFQMLLLVTLAGVGLALAVIGVYGVVAYFASVRTSEIGLRVALGARTADVLGLLAKQGLAPVLVGLALGLGLALAATRLLESSLFGVTPTDPATYALVAVLFVIVAGVAILIPGRRATQIDPTRALETR